MDHHKGSCLCGDVQIIAVGSPCRVGVCHCSDCRKHHGAMFYAAAIFAEASVSVFGETKDFRGCHFCVRCGSSVFAKTNDEIEIHLGVLDNTEGLSPTYECWATNRASWLPEFPQTKQFERDRDEKCEARKP